MSGHLPLLAVPNVSEGRNPQLISAIADRFIDAGVKLLDVHSDSDHHRSVFTIAGQPGTLSRALLAGAELASREIDLLDPRGAHPHAGAVDVLPIVYLSSQQRGAACAEALLLGDLIGHELGLPVFLYGDLAEGRSRAELRRGGVRGLSMRVADGELAPDFGPANVDLSSGAALVSAREPLVAFNLVLGPDEDMDKARKIAAAIREGGPLGMPGLRAIAVALTGDLAQVSMNVERPLELPLVEIVKAVRQQADVSYAELVGLAPRAAFEGFPPEMQIVGFDPQRHIIENALGL